METNDSPLFEMDPAPSFPFTVPVVRPGGVTQSLHLIGKHMDREDFAEYCRNGTTTKETQFVLGLLSGWDSRHGSYSAERMTKLLNDFPRAGRSIFRAYRDELLGAEEGN